MDYYFLCDDFFEQYKSTEEIKTSIRNYIHNNYDISKDIYFEPKKIEKEIFEKQLPHLSMCNSKCNYIIRYISARVKIFD